MRDGLIATAAILTVTAWLAFPADAAAGPAAAAASDSTESPPADDAAARSPGPMPSWLSTIRLMGTLEAEARWSRHSLDPTGPASSGSDLFLRLFELAISSNLSYWAEAFAVINTENVDDEDDPGTGGVVLDEAHLDLGQDGVPWTLVLGYRTQPFGAFESHLVTDPITQDGYETQKTGATIGWSGLPGSALSLTVYQGAVQMSELQGSRLVDGAALGWRPPAARQLDSWIVNASAGSDDGDLTVYGAWLGEPGRDRRNQVINLGLHAVMPGLEAIVLDGDWMRAVQRETYPGADRAHEDGALSATLTYRFVVRDRQTLGGANFRARREHLRTHPLEVSVRYEHFDDDGLTADLGVWSLRDRWSTGGRYTFYESETSSVYALLELQRRRYRRPLDASTFHDENTRVYAKLGMSF